MLKLLKGQAVTLLTGGKDVRCFDGFQHLWDDFCLLIELEVVGEGKRASELVKIEESAQIVAR